jgi:hypothetical protein
MARTRTIYNNEALFAGGSPATGTTTDTTGSIKKLHRVQSIGNSFEYALENINEYGKMAAIDRVNLDGSTSSLEFTYYVTDFENEKNLGFTINSAVSAISGFASKAEDDRNYYRYVAPEGLDAVGLGPTQGAVLAVGNGFINSYSLDVAVGAFPTASVSVQGLNSASYPSGSAQPVPSVDPVTGRKWSGTFTLPTVPTSSSGKPSVIKPGDVKISFSNNNAALFQSLADASINIQKASVKVDFKLESIKKLGSNLSVSREMQYPIDVQVSIEALMSDLTTNTGLVDFICNTPQTDITIDLYKSTCDSGGPTTAASDIFAKIIVKNAKLTSEDLSGSIGPNNTVSMQFTSQVGAANDSTNGMFFSGVIGYTGANVPQKSA